MRAYKTQHAYYCGVDLHARSLFVNVLDDTVAKGLAPPPDTGDNALSAHERTPTRPAGRAED